MNTSNAQNGRNSPASIVQYLHSAPGKTQPVLSALVQQSGKVVQGRVITPFGVRKTFIEHRSISGIRMVTIGREHGSMPGFQGLLTKIEAQLLSSRGKRFQIK